MKENQTFDVKDSETFYCLLPSTRDDKLSDFDKFDGKSRCNFVLLQNYHFQWFELDVE